MNDFLGRLGVLCAVGMGLAVTAPSTMAQCAGSKSAAATAKSGHEDIVQTAVAAGNFTTLVTAVKAAGLAEALAGPGPFTVFAPTDEAFAKIDKATLANLLKPENKAKLAGILKYHVVPGRLLAADVVAAPAFATLDGQRIDITVKDKIAMVDGAKITATDIAASNGVIHVIDTVIMPSDHNIVETAASAGSFKTLIAACKAAGLDSVLSGEGPFTVFAPTDEAFAKLPAGTVEMLLKPENKDTLAAILKYHVVSGRVFSPDAVKAGAAPTVQGDTVKIMAADGKVKINDATVVSADLDASNGVIHVIDRVILPAAVAKKLTSAEGGR